MVYDVFPFYNELDLLELRLHELREVVDYHILIESNLTFQRQPKPLHFNQNRDRYKEFLPKIIHLIVDTFPSPNPFHCEYFQRDFACQILDSCRDDDIIISADADEIVAASAVRIYKESPSPGPRAICQKVYYYWMNCLASDNCAAPVIMPFKALRQLSGVAEARVRRDSLPRLYKGGWHFAYLGGADAIIDKIKAFAHEEYNNPEFCDRDRIQNVLDEQVNLFGGKKCVVVELDDTFPAYLIEHRDKFEQYLR